MNLNPIIWKFQPNAKKPKWESISESISSPYKTSSIGLSLKLNKNFINRWKSWCATIKGKIFVRFLLLEYKTNSWAFSLQILECGIRVFLNEMSQVRISVVPIFIAQDMKEPLQYLRFKPKDIRVRWCNRVQNQFLNLQPST